jgi:predicted nucleic-acid-binding protein
MRAVDTNVLVRLAVRDDTRQVEAAEDLVSGGAWVSKLVLLEFVWVLTSVYGFGRSEIGNAVEILLNHAQLTVEESEVVASALQQYRKAGSVRFSDCLVLEVARKVGHLPLGTFDRELGRLSGTRQLDPRGRRTGGRR